MTQGSYNGSTVALLVWLLLQRRSEGTCPTSCLCTSDSVNCGSSGLTQLPLLLPPTASSLDLSYNRLTWLDPASFSRLPRLETLRLARNELAALGPEVFRNASGLRHLDLSSNQLRTLEHHCFQGLRRLEELLLYNNRIGRMESGALSGLSSLRKAYLSLNQLTDFPFFSVADRSHPFLAVLDLSSNRFTTLPWEDVMALPGSLQKGLYLHNNSLMCDCSMYGVFRHWEQRGYNPVRDFADEHACLIYGDARASVRFLQNHRFFQNCTAGQAASLPATVPTSNLAIYEGERVRLDCRTSLKGRGLSFAWLTPNQEYVVAPGGGANDSLVGVFPNGTLEIRAARANDSGLYACTALDYVRMLNATSEVNVTVVRASADSFSTGYTTLLGCAVSLLLILMYLYLTPCRCGCCKQPLPPGVPVPTYDPSTLSSIFSPSMGHQDPAKAQSGRHVVFMEPVLKEQSGGLKAALATNQPILHWEWDTTELT